MTGGGAGNGRLARWDRALLRLETGLALLGGLAIFSLMLLAVASIGGRNLLNAPLPGYVDVIEQLMPLIAYGGLAYCHRLGGHVRMDILARRLPPRALWALEAALTLLTVLLVLALVWGGHAHFARSFDLSAPLWSRDSSLDIGLPLWPMKLLVALVFALFLLRLALHLCACLGAVAHPGRPVTAAVLPGQALDAAKSEAARVRGTPHG